MTKEEILAMKSGMELNISVAKYVMGHDVVSDELMGQTERLLDDDGGSIWSTPLPYSEEISAALTVVAEMIKRGYRDAASWKDYGNGTYAPAEAICKRALLAMLKKEV